MRLTMPTALLLGLIVAPAFSQTELTQADLLRRMIDLRRLVLPPVAGERTVTFSAADRSSGSDGWDTLGQASGPGVLTNLWFRQPQGELRLLMDGAVVWEGPLADLLSGKFEPLTEPFVRGGHHCCFPIGFAQDCRIEARGMPDDYLVTCTLFAGGTRVARFVPELDEAARQARDEVARALTQGLSERQLVDGQRTMPVAAAEEIGPGEVLTQALEKAGTVRALYVALTDRTDPRELYALHRLVLRVYVDGQKSPNVEVPLIDFFGAGFDHVPFSSLVAGTNKALPVPLPGRPLGRDRFLYSFWPMPYRDGLRVEIENRNEARRKIGLLLLMQVETRPPAPDSLRFFARFRRCDPCRTAQFVMLEAHGPGRLVGLVLNIDCPRQQWWGDGPLRAWIDGQRPTLLACGADGYIGQAGPLRVEQSGLLGVTRAGPYGKHSAYRWHVGDDIAFQTALRVATVNTQAELEDTHFSSVVYWYAPPGSEHKFAALQDADVDVPGLRIPGAIEIEGQVRGSDWGNVIKEKYAGGVELSGGQAAGISTDRPVQIVLPSAREQSVLLKVRVHPQRAFETIRISDAQEQLIGIVKYDGRADGIYVVGSVQLKRGDNTFVVQCSPRAVLDCWIVEPSSAPGECAPDGN